MTSPYGIAIGRIRQLRRRHGLTQQDLADRLNLLGAGTKRTAVARVELGQRGLSVNELFQYAMALDVAPVHLVSPPDSDEPISLGPNMELSPAEMRAWMRGQHPVSWQDQRIYYSETPKNEFRPAATEADGPAVLPVSEEMLADAPVVAAHIKNRLVARLARFATRAPE